MLRSDRSSKDLEKGARGVSEHSMFASNVPFVEEMRSSYVVVNNYSLSTKEFARRPKNGTS